jgi:hypothetical protein
MHGIVLFFLARKYRLLLASNETLRGCATAVIDAVAFATIRKRLVRNFFDEFLRGSASIHWTGNHL